MASEKITIARTINKIIFKVVEYDEKTETFSVSLKINLKIKYGIIEDAPNRAIDKGDIYSLNKKMNTKLAANIREASVVIRAQPTLVPPALVAS